MNSRMRQSERKRLLWQSGFFLLTNSHLPGYLHGTIYRGPLKHVCVPGLNCYSCPGALGACPLGSLQAGLYDTRQILPFYVLGLLLLFGLLCGRLICGLLCPFGLLQDVLGRLPGKKFYPELQRAALDRSLRKIKYILLFLFVFLLPYLGRFIPEMMAPWFCKYVCPSGTVLAGWPLVALNASLRDIIGFLFTWKSALALLILTASVFIPRFFCRYLCPLGAFYGLFNKIAYFQLHFTEEQCIKCGACKRACPMGVELPQKFRSAECIRCARCVASCPTSCLHLGFRQPSAVQQPIENTLK